MAEPIVPSAAAQPTTPQAPILLMGEDGDVYRLPSPEKASAAIASKKFRPLTPDEALEHRVQKEEEGKGALGSVAQGFESAINQASFGAEEALARGGLSPEEIAEREARQKYHETSRTIGGAAGFAGSLAYGGELFKGAELAGQAAEHLIAPAQQIGHAALAARVAGKAANYATQGALLATPQAIVQAAFGDPKQAAETLLWGIGPGALLGGGAELVSSAVGSLGRKASELAGSGRVSDALEEFALGKTPQAYGAQRSITDKLSPEWRAEVSEFAHERGLIQPGMNKRDLGVAVKQAHAEYSSRIGETIKALDGSLGKSEDAMRAALKPGQLGSEIRNAFDSAEMGMAMNADQARALEIVAGDADRLPVYKADGTLRKGGAFADTDHIRFEDAQGFLTMLRQKYVKSIGRAVNEGGAKGLEVVTPLDKMKAEAYQVAKTVLHKAGDDVAVASNQPALVGRLVADKRSLAKVAELEKWAANAEAREAGNKVQSLTDTIAEHGEGGFAGKAVRAVGAGIGAIVGGVPGAFVGEKAGAVAGGILDHIVKHWMEDKGLILATSLARRAAKEGPDVLAGVIGAEGNQRVAMALEGVRDTVRRMAVHGIASTSARTQEHMKALLGSTSGLTPDQAYDKLGGRLTQLASNPQALVSASSALASPFQNAAPEVAAAYQQKLADAVGYLHASLPKPSEPPAPFTPDYWSPSAQAKLAFHDRAAIVANPGSVMDHVERGTLSDDHLDAMAAIYPGLLGVMQDEIKKMSAEHPDMKMPMAERASIAKLLGSTTEPVLQPAAAAIMSEIYRSSENGQQAGATTGAAKGKIKKLPGSASAFSHTTYPGELPR